jgi:hypothetical protein
VKVKELKDGEVSSKRRPSAFLQHVSVIISLLKTKSSGAIFCKGMLSI